MLRFIQSIFRAHYEASLCMMHECVRKCPDEPWEGQIGNDTIRQVANHTVVFTDLYLSTSESTFKLRDIHRRGGNERAQSAFACRELKRLSTWSIAARQQLRRWKPERRHRWRTRRVFPGCRSHAASCICTTSGISNITLVN